MKRISQKSVSLADCGIACVAMVTDCAYEVAMQELVSAVRNGKYYTRHKHLIQAIIALGKNATLKKFIGFRSIEGRAIVATNKRANGHWHWVVYDGESIVPFIFDPKPHKTGKIRDFRGLNGFGNYLQIE